MGYLSNIFYMLIKNLHSIKLKNNQNGGFYGLLSSYTHFHSDEKRKQYMKRIKGRKNDVWVSLMNDPSNPFHERARVVQVFIGKADFFFCHWYAESEQAITDKLASLGADDFCITMATKTKKPVVDQRELEKMLLEVD